MDETPYNMVFSNNNPLFNNGFNISKSVYMACLSTICICVGSTDWSFISDKIVFSRLVGLFYLSK